MTMIEVVVSLLLLGIVGSGFSVGMVQTLTLTQDDRIRQQATHVAERELEIARNRFQHADESGQLGALAAGTLTNSEPLTGQTRGEPMMVDGQEFNIRRTQYLITNGNGTNPCDGGSTVTYLSMGVTVEVSWTQNGQPRQVENRTILTPQKGIEGDVGYIAAKVTDASGGPVNGLPVNATGPGGAKPPVTTVDGCAVFMFSSPGTYTLTLEEPGYVNYEGYQSVSKSSTLQMGRLGVLPFTYDQEVNLLVSFDTPSGYDVPETLPGVTVANSGLIGGELTTNGTNEEPVSVSGLWPFPDGYSVWAGTCDQSDPGINVLGYPRPPGIVLDGGDTRSVDVPLYGVAVRSVDSAGQTVSGAVLEATPVNAAGCQGSDGELMLGTTGGDGTLETSLPAGAWTIAPAIGCPTLDPAPAEGEPNCPAQTEALVVVDADGNAVDGPGAETYDVVVISS